MSQTRRLAVGQCPQCKEVIWSEQADEFCPRCKQPLPELILKDLPKLKMNSCKHCGGSFPKSAQFCTTCGKGTANLSIDSVPLIRESDQGTAAAPARNLTPNPFPNPSPPVEKSSNERYTRSVMKRYRDAYWTARFTVTFGQIVKLVGVLLGLAVGVLMDSLFYQNHAPRGPSDLISGVFGFVVFAFFFVIGVIICAEGQKLKAELDSAVYASPFMNDEERARVMSL
jgi:hypothetical protein